MYQNKNFGSGGQIYLKNNFGYKTYNMTGY